MRVGIFYFSLNSDHVGMAADAVRTPISTAHGNVGFVRMDEMDAVDECEAMALARPLDDEAVMNTHPLDVEDWDKN